MSPRLGELVIEPAEGWTTAPTAPTTPAGLHGTTHETSVGFLLAGAGVHPGRAPDGPRHVDIAPTIAAVLGVPTPAGTQGRVLTEALTAR